jgi:hypothetical protein
MLFEVTRMRTTIYLGLLLFLACSTGCRGGPKPGPPIETYAAEAKQNQLVAGEKQNIEITVRYHTSQPAAAKLKYKVQFSAPNGLTVTPPSWDVEQNLAANDAGLNYSKLISIEVAADAALGEREVIVTVTPAHGATSTSTLKFQVTNKGG